jgi:Icc-related predicted phosphoesterase
MKIKIISDIHLNFHKNKKKSLNEIFKSKMMEQPDVFIVAGDFHEAGGLLESVKWFADNFEEVVFTPGNHDLYHGSFKQIRDEVAQANDTHSNVHGLINDSVEINGVSFHGSTMWFSHKPINDLHMYRMNDFRYIENFRDEVYEENKKAIEFFNENVKEGDVVITHHSPSMKSSHPRYARDPLNNFYVCDMENFMCEKKPSVWAHGHTHDSYSYKVCDTHVVCNPFGYWNYEENYKFNPELIVEI